MRQAVVILNQANIRANWKDLHSAVIPTFQLNLSYTLRIRTPYSVLSRNGEQIKLLSRPATSKPMPAA